MRTVSISSSGDPNALAWMARKVGGGCQIRSLSAHRPYQWAEWRVAIDIIDEINRVARGRIHARRTKNLIYRQISFVQPKSEFRIVLCGKKRRHVSSSSNH